MERSLTDAQLQAAADDGGGLPDPAGRNGDQDRRTERHRPRPRGRLPARGRDRRRPQGAQAADRDRCRHPRSPSLLDRGGPRPAGRRAVAAWRLGRRPERRDAGTAPREARHLRGRRRRALGGAALPCRGERGRLQRHAALWPLDAPGPRGRHPALPHRRRMLPRRRAVRLQGDDLREGRKRPLHGEPEDLEGRHLHPEDLGRRDEGARGCTTRSSSSRCSICSRRRATSARCRS